PRLPEHPALRRGIRDVRPHHRPGGHLEPGQQPAAHEHRPLHEIALWGTRAPRVPGGLELALEQSQAEQPPVDANPPPTAEPRTAQGRAGTARIAVHPHHERIRPQADGGSALRGCHRGRQHQLAGSGELPHGVRSATVTGPARMSRRDDPRRLAFSTFTCSTRRCHSARAGALARMLASIGWGWWAKNPTMPAMLTVAATANRAPVASPLRPNNAGRATTAPPASAPAASDPRAGVADVRSGRSGGAVGGAGQFTVSGATCVMSSGTWRGGGPSSVAGWGATRK